MDWMYQGDCHHFRVLKVVGVNQLFKEKGISGFREYFTKLLYIKLYKLQVEDIDQLIQKQQ